MVSFFVLIYLVNAKTEFY